MSCSNLLTDNFAQLWFLGHIVWRERHLNGPVLALFWLCNCVSVKIRIFISVLVEVCLLHIRLLEYFKIIYIYLLFFFVVLVVSTRLVVARGSCSIWSDLFTLFNWRFIFVFGWLFLVHLFEVHIVLVRQLAHFWLNFSMLRIFFIVEVDCECNTFLQSFYWSNFSWRRLKFFKINKEHFSAFSPILFRVFDLLFWTRGSVLIRNKHFYFYVLLSHWLFILFEILCQLFSLRLLLRPDCSKFLVLLLLIQLHLSDLSLRSTFFWFFLFYNVG